MGETSINTLLKKAVELKASDIHCISDDVPSFRIDGNIVKIKTKPMTEQDINVAIEKMAPSSMRDTISYSYDFDFPYEIENLARFRVNVAMSFGRRVMTIRIIPYNIATFDILNLPPMIEKFTHFDNGIVLVTGVAGSGKSTTIAALLNHINNNFRKHIITIEDPIEYVYKSKKSILTQRQIGIDTPNYIDGIKFALRQDPNVILIGEIRDKETVESALHAAETGHLIFATLHTFNAVQTINRILSFFNPNEREMIRSQFAEVFRGSISQKLLPQANGIGRIPATEILFSTPTIKDFMKKDELEEIYKLVQKGGYDNMLTFNQSLYHLVKNHLITEEVALAHSDNEIELKHYIGGVYSGSEVF